jgi:dTDP-L-rhamnose 4-epimerase
MTTSMSSERVFITGGAGFIGSRLARALAERGQRVWIYDNLLAQVHGPDARFPEFGAGITCIRGDVADAAALAAAVREAAPTHVYHLAAETGTGQSMDEVPRYCQVNVMGTAHLIDALRAPGLAVRRVVLSSTRAVYGEGAYAAGTRIVVPPPRLPERMRAGQFVPLAVDGAALAPVATSETTPVSPCSIYASTKLTQEYLLQQCALTASWSLALLRFQNVYGPGQSLRNPYTGVLSVFARQLLSGQGLEVYEDGEITRDFVLVDDVVAALVLAGEARLDDSAPINIGTGAAVTILQAARELARCVGRPDAPIRVSGAFRPGDIRHAVADIARARAVLGWQPRVSFAEGARRLVDWARAHLAQLQ